MISIKDIQQGIEKSIKRVFPNALVKVDPYRHVKGPAFIVKCVSYAPSKFNPTSAHRIYHFDIVYFAPMDEPVHTMDEKGQRLVEAFLYPVEFAGRYIQPQNVNTVKIDKDFHVEFDLDFFDEVELERNFEYMQSLEFHIELSPDKGE